MKTITQTITTKISGIFSPEERYQIPESPGIYIYKDKDNNILYIGKAKNLRKRVASYFIKTPIFLKTHLLIQQINIIDIIVVNTESEALFLEATLIKKHLPKFNINFKDGKFYPYIKVTTTDEFPRFFMTRNKIEDKNLYFGPYTNVKSVRGTLEVLQKIFQLRTCRNLPKTECLEYHMNRCSAPCIKKITAKKYNTLVNKAIKFLSGNRKELIQELHDKMEKSAKNLLFEKAQLYKEQLDSIYNLDEQQDVYLNSKDNIDIVGIATQNGQFGIVISQIRQGKLMGKEGFIVKNTPQYSEKLTLAEVLEEFIINHYSERTKHIHCLLINQEYTDLAQSLTEWFEADGDTLPVRSISDADSHENTLLSLTEKNAAIHLERIVSEPDLLEVLASLQNELKLQNFPSIIEGFDIAKLDGTLASGVMVQFQGGEPNKNNYRFFNIQAENQQDDFIAIEEAVYRRYSRILDNNESLPQLIVIDGGKGQLSAALKSLKKLHIDTVDIISLAKQEEEIFQPNQKIGTILPKNSKVLHLLQRVRDESHRFSQYQLHRRMDKKMKS